MAKLQPKPLWKDDDWQDYSSLPPQHHFNPEKDKGTLKVKKEEEESEEDSEDFVPDKTNRSLNRGWGALQKRKERRSLEQAGLPVPEHLQPNRVSLNKAQQAERRALQQKLNSLQQAFMACETKGRAKKIWAEMQDLKEDMKDLLSGCSQPAKAKPVHPKPPKPPAPKVKPEKGTPSTGGESGSLAKPEEAAKKEKKARVRNKKRKKKKEKSKKAKEEKPEAAEEPEKAAPTAEPEPEKAVEPKQPEEGLKSLKRQLTSRRKRSQKSCWSMGAWWMWRWKRMWRRIWCRWRWKRRRRKMFP